MKFIISQMTVFFAAQSNQRNMRIILRFIMFISALIVLYSLIFHWLMALEGREFSIVTGFYWTMTVMSTLGFGDITFSSDAGRLFSIVVLFSGILLFMLILPFAFIRFIYQPWLEAQRQTIIPTELPPDTHGHVLILGTDDTALSLASRLEQYAVPHYIITPDVAEAGALFDRRVPVMRGEMDSAETYLAARVKQAALVVALHDDMKNTNIAVTVHDFAPDTMLAASVRNYNSVDILELAGCQHVFNLSTILGESMARRVFGGRTESNIIGKFEDLCIAETAAEDTPLVGKSLLELNLRAQFGINVVGIWQGSEFMGAAPDTVIDSGAVLLLAGTEENIKKYDEYVRCCNTTPKPEDPVIVLGGGTVGMCVVRTLERRGIPFRLVDHKPSVLKDKDERYILGGAEDINILRKAGIDKAHCVVITTHNDDLNIYLTVYCRKLKPDLQIISRSIMSRNTQALYGAGANVVLSGSSIITNAIVNLLSPGRVYMLTEGMNVFRVAMPPSLVGKNLRNSGIRRRTSCNVVAMRRDGVMQVSLDPDYEFEAKDELVVIGTVEAEKNFVKQFQ